MSQKFAPNTLQNTKDMIVGSRNTGQLDSNKHTAPPCMAVQAEAAAYNRTHDCSVERVCKPPCQLLVQELNPSCKCQQLSVSTQRTSIVQILGNRA